LTSSSEKHVTGPDSRERQHPFLEPLELEDLDTPLPRQRPATEEEDPGVFDRVTAVPGELDTEAMTAAMAKPPSEDEHPSGLFELSEKDGDVRSTGVHLRPTAKPPEAELETPDEFIEPAPPSRTDSASPAALGALASSAKRSRRFSSRPPRPPSRPTLERASRRSLTPQKGAIELEIELVEVKTEQQSSPGPRPDALEAELSAPPPISHPLVRGLTAPPLEDPEVVAMKDRYATGDFSGALVVAEGILENHPSHDEALRCRERCTEVLSQMYLARLGSLTQVVQVALSGDQIRWLSLDHRAGFLLSLVDGISSIEELLDISSMPRLEALRILHGLLDQRVIALSG
jgi:hypothetical protein